MSFIFEVYLNEIEDLDLETRILAVVTEGGGYLDFRELPGGGMRNITLTYDFPTLEQAEATAHRVKQLDVYLEGPYDWGD